MATSSLLLRSGVIKHWGGKLKSWVVRLVLWEYRTTFQCLVGASGIMTFPFNHLHVYLCEMKAITALWSRLLYSDIIQIPLQKTIFSLSSLSSLCSWWNVVTIRRACRQSPPPVHRRSLGAGTPPPYGSGAPADFYRILKFAVGSFRTDFLSERGQCFGSTLWDVGVPSRIITDEPQLVIYASTRGSI